MGPADATEREQTVAADVGRRLAAAGAIVLTGGHGGVMEAACRGAQANHGTTIGILPGSDRAEANPYVEIAIPTGLGELRNGLIVRAADALIAVGGAYGTLSEVALALKTGVPVIGLDTWQIDGIVRADHSQEAVQRALEAIGRAP